MNKEYSNAVSYLYGLQKYGIKLGLDNPRRLLSVIGNPHDSFKSVHIAGTNGKGSTSAMIASVLKSAGFKVGLFTSPHLVSFTERIKVGDMEISEREVVELTNEIREVVEREQESNLASLQSAAGEGGSPAKQEFLPTFFEFVTAMGFLYFKRNNVDWAVVETGMGGRLDATNILMPEVSVITNIGYDHREFLGQTLEEISGEKAGIIKSGVPVVSASQEDGVARVIGGKTSEKGSPLFIYGKEFSSCIRSADVNGIAFDYRGKERLNGLHVPLCGMHQMENASVAIRSIELIMDKEGISYQDVREGLALTRWPGRLELIREVRYGYDVLVDGAHNPSASRALAEALKTYFLPIYKKVVLILGIMADKDVEGIMRPLLPIATEVIFVSPGYERAAPPEKLAEYAAGMGFTSKVAHSVEEALDLAGTGAEGDPHRRLTVVTGSFYTIGEAKTCLGLKGVLARLRE